ncbi:MAG: class I SAM-dependent methyltransferase [Synergistaceae bacterium]|nr:class I SAM-dependent methyltransferase [Synergistaceae bacterium]
MFDFMEKHMKPPTIYAEGTSIFWKDDHISKKLLEIHLDPNVELASRKPDFIERSLNWISETVPATQYPKLLDIGCGPGLYAEKFARAGYEVMGVDFSKRSIEYAGNIARTHKLPITYICDDYLKMEIPTFFDFVTLIYCDYGALSKDNRKLLMKKVYDRLNLGGKFLLDVCSVRHYESFEEKQTWEMHDGGFWSAERYYCFNLNRKYQDHTTLNRSVVITQSKTSIYNIWNHCFTTDSLMAEAAEAGFRMLQIYSDVAGKPYSDDSMTIAILLEK